MYSEMNSPPSSYWNTTEMNSTISFWNSSANSTRTMIGTTSEYKLTIDSIILSGVILSLLAMGCEVDKKELFHHLKRPVGISIGMFSQFILMPFMAFLLSRTMSMNKFYAAGILIVSCSPGGTVSNIYTYFCDGDISLSVTMTTASSVLAIGMMPLNILIYGSSYETGDVVIPYTRLAISLGMVTSPAAVGMILRWKTPRIAFYIAKIGSWLVFAMIITVSVLQLLWFSDTFVDVPPKLCVLTVSLPIIGLTMSYVLASVLQQTVKVRKAIAIECGIQNVPTALAVIALSFPQEEQRDLVAVPWIYGFTMFFCGAVGCIAYQTYKTYKSFRNQLPVKENGAQEVPMV